MNVRNKVEITDNITEKLLRKEGERSYSFTKINVKIIFMK